MKKHAIVLGFLLCLVFPGLTLAQADRRAEANALLGQLTSSSQVERIHAAKQISRAGLIDKRLYAEVARQLQAGYATARDPYTVDEMAWLCKALAASGDSGYRPLLDEVAGRAPNDKLRRYAAQSSSQIEDYAKRVTVMNSSENRDASLSPEENRLLNMLASDDLKLTRDAAMKITRRGKTDPKVFDAAATALTALLAKNTDDSLADDTMSWLCKALAASGDRKYAAPLQEVLNQSGSAKVRSYASKALNAL